MMICVGTISAQENEPIKTLFDSQTPQHNGGYGAITVKYGKILDQDAFFTGLRGGWLINHRFTLGLAGNGLVSRVTNDAWLPEDPKPGLEARLLTGYGGLLLEPVIFHNELFHASFPIVIGAGGATYGYWDNNYWGHVDVPDYTGDAYFALEPGVELEINVVRFMRINIGASYLYTSDVRLPEVDPNFMRGFLGTFTIKFGSF